MDEVASLVIKVSADEAAKAEKTLDDFAKSAASADVAVKRLEQEAARSAKQIEQLEQRLDRTSRQAGIAATRSRDLERQLAAVTREAAESTVKIRDLEKRLTEAERALKRMADEANKTDGALNKASKSSGAFANNIKGMVAGVASVAAVMAVVRQGVSDWNDFDIAIKQVSSISGYTAEQLKAVRGEVLELSRAMGMNATEAAEGLFAALQDGIRETDAVDFLKVAAETAQGGVTTIDTAVNALTNVINAYGLGAEDAREVSDKLFQTVLQGKATFEELASGMSNTLVPAKALGVSYEEVFAQLIAITKQGTSASEGFTQITSAITAVLNPSDEMLAVFRELGVETAQQAVAQVGLQGILEKTRELYEGNSASLVKALGRVEALKATYATTGEKAMEVAKGLDAVNNSSGATARAAEANANNLSKALQSVKTAVVQLAEALENSMGIFSKASSMLRGLSDLVGALAGSDVSFGTSSLLEGAEGAMGYLQIDDRIAQLEKYKAYVQENKDFMGDITYDNQPWEDSRNSKLPPEFGRLSGRLLGVNDASSVYKDIQSEIDSLISKKAKLLETDQAEIDFALRMKNIAEDRNITEEQRTGRAKAALDDLNAELKAQEDLKAATESKAATEQKAAEQRTKDFEAAQVQEKEGLKLMEEQAKSIDKAWEDAQKKQNELNEKNEKAQQDELEHIRKLGTNKRQELELERQKIEARKAQNNLSAEDVRLADAAIAKLDKQLELLDENGEAIKRARVVDESKVGRSKRDLGGYSYDLSPIFQTPAKNELERLAQEEDDIRESYQRRQREILEIEGITEAERASLQSKAHAQMLEAEAHFTEERNRASLEMAADFFGNLGTVAQAFGKKGYRIAQAAAIAETTVNTYSAAMGAYKSLSSIPYVGPALGVAAAAAAVASGFMNIQKIRSTEYSGAYEFGGMIPAGSYGLVGEAGPEFVRGPAMVQSARSSADRMRNSGQAAEESEAKPWTLQVFNLPGQDIDVTEDKEGRIVKLAVKRTKEELTKEAQDGSGTVFPTMAKNYNLKRGGNR